MKRFVRSKFVADEDFSFRLMRSSIFSNEASTAAPLGPLLGQFQVPMSEFCDAFNKITVDRFPESFELPVRLYKSESRYEAFINIPRLTFMLHQVLFEYGFDLNEWVFTTYLVNAEDLWFIIGVLGSVYYEGYKPSYEISLEVFGYLHSSIFQVRVLCTVLLFFVP